MTGLMTDFFINLAMAGAFGGIAFLVLRHLNGGRF